MLGPLEPKPPLTHSFAFSILNADFVHSTMPLHCAFFYYLHQVQGKMKIDLLLWVLCQFYLGISSKFKPELKKNILNFGYGIDYKYEGMLAHSFNRFNVVTKFMLPLLGDLKFSNQNYDNTCAYLDNENAQNTEA